MRLRGMLPRAPECAEASDGGVKGDIRFSARARVRWVLLARLSPGAAGLTLLTLPCAKPP